MVLDRNLPSGPTSGDREPDEPIIPGGSTLESGNQDPIKVAFQGEPGAFSHVAAHKLFGPEITLLPQRGFDDLFQAVVSGVADRGVVPIENSLAGSVHENYDRLRSHRLHINGETQVRIRLCLIVRPGTPITDVRQAASHPVALQQCRQFFLHHPQINSTASYDTAGSVRDLMAEECEHQAAIGSSLAAGLYGGEILEEDIEDNPENFTRFLAISRHESPMGPTHKTSLVVTLPNEPGSLYRALGAFAKRKVDLCKLESRPIPGRPWEYRFYLDVRGDPGKEVGQSIAELCAVAKELQVLGSYPEID